MNVAVIFAGGTGSRMNLDNLPKQFLTHHEKPILIYTLEKFQNHNEILMHDGVRPFIDKDTISKDIASVKEHGSAITVAPAVETVALKTENGLIGEIMDRSLCQLAKAPQCFFLKDLMEAHREVFKSGRTDLIDTAFLMQSQGHPLYTVEGRPENIKITTPNDYYTFCALIDAEKIEYTP